MGNTSSSTKKEYTQQDLAKKKNYSICLVSIFGKVYNVAKYLPEHPGGENILFNASGDILDDVFTDGVHRNLGKGVHALLARYQVGVLVKNTEEQQIANRSSDSPSPVLGTSITTNKP